jgi:hypothetical protein
VIRVFRLRGPEPIAAAAAWNPGMAQDSTFLLSGETNISDLPRTLRREHEARAREARERDGPSLGSASSHTAAAPVAHPAPPAADMTYMASDKFAAVPDVAGSTRPVPAIVRAVDVPFADLVAFFLKAVIAAIPAFILMMAVLWGIGQMIETVAPNLLKMKILISFPNS